MLRHKIIRIDTTLGTLDRPGQISVTLLSCILPIRLEYFLCCINIIRGIAVRVEEDMNMSGCGVTNLSAFTLLAVGTVGLLVGEFAADWSRNVTLPFASFNILGLIILTLVIRTIGKQKID